MFLLGFYRVCVHLGIRPYLRCGLHCYSLELLLYPIKVNVFLWRLSLNKLPSRVNLDRKGIDVGSILCPISQDDVELVNHTFFICERAKDLWDLLAKLWELDIPICANIFKW